MTDWDSLEAMASFERLLTGDVCPPPGVMLWLIDPPLDPGPTPSGPVRRHCGHEVGFAALTGVFARLLRDGQEARACHAAQMRGRLPVGRHA